MITLFELQNAQILGLLFGILALGVYVTFRILDFPDLTVEGSFVFGAAVAARLITGGFDPFFAIIMAILAGIAAGAITGFFHTTLKIPKLLSGILTMFGLYSINIRVMGTSNLPIDSFSATPDATLISRAADALNWFARLFGQDASFGFRDATPQIVVGVICVIAVIALLRLFFNTEVGYALRATGDNEPMVRAQGISTNKMKVYGLMIGNALAALAGALVAQQNAVSDAGDGAGMIVIGLAAVIIGEVFFKDKNNYRAFIAVVVGSVIYRLIIAFVLRYGNPHDFQLWIALVIAVALALPMFKDKFNTRLKKTSLGNGKGGGE